MTSIMWWLPLTDRRELHRSVAKGEEEIKFALKWAESILRQWLQTHDEAALIVSEPRRSLPQNDKFHAMCEDVARQCEWMGKKRTKDQWKVLFVSGHSIATGRGAEMVPGLEGEFVNIRESTARMSRSRLKSLIEYVQAWCAGNEVKLREETWTQDTGVGQLSADRGGGASVGATAGQSEQ